MRTFVLTRFATAAVAIALSCAGVASSAGATAAPDPAVGGVEKGVTKACLLTETGTECYATERELYAAHPELDAVSTTTSKTALAASVPTNCSTNLKLYTGIFYTGTLVVTSIRQAWINLPSSINNKVSSYVIGACNAVFADYVGGPLYPGNTSANASAATMLTGWDNRVSAVYIP